MRKNEPSSRWINKVWEHYGQAGGWTGPATLSALRRRVIELYRLGASSAVAGAVVAKEYLLFSKLQDAKEMSR